jgi:hypothetical protein
MTVKRSSIDETVSGNDCNALEATHSRALAERSQEIATAMHATGQGKPTEPEN